MSIKVKIDSYDHEGRGITRVNNKVVFIPNTIINEEHLIEITTDKKNYSEAISNEIIIKSPKRISPKCPYYDKCGGCNYLHLDIKDEEEIKTNNVINIIKKYSNLDINPKFISAKNNYNYRNKIELKIQDGLWGYYNNSSHDFIEIDECKLASKAINKIISNKELFNIQNGEIIIRSNYNDELLIKVITKEKCQINIADLTKDNKIVGILVNDKIIYGEDFFFERVGGYLFKVNINSFFQINLDILNEVFKIFKDKELGVVVDLYCGVGTLGISAKKDKLFGIEIVKEAVLDAMENSKINKQNNLYMLGDSSNIKNINEHIDSIIVDPPRNGLSKETINNIMDIKPNTIIYMSCNPITLARDLNILKEHYIIESTFVLNMFPRTKHVETLCILEGE